MGGRLCVLAVVALVGVIALPPVAAAEEGAPDAAPEGAAAMDPDDEARLHFEQGVALVADGDSEAALAEFRISYRIRRLPVVLYNIGVVERRLRRYGDAVDSFRSYLADAEERGEPAGRIEEVRSIVTELESILATVSVEVSEPEAHVFVDGELVGTTPLDEPLRLEAGRHELEVQLDGFQTHLETLEVHGREHRDVAVELRAARHRQWYEQWWFWVPVGVVLAGAAVAIAVPLAVPPAEADFGPVRIVTAEP